MNNDQCSMFNVQEDIHTIVLLHYCTIELSNYRTNSLMRFVHSLEEAQLTEDSVVTIGSFDGVHRGHQALIKQVRAAALNAQRASVVITFFPHPSGVLGRAQPY